MGYWLLSSLRPVSVGLLEDGDVGIAGVDTARVLDARRDVIAVAFTEGVLLPADDEVHPAFEDEARLGGMSVLGQVHILSEFHENDLVPFGLGQIGPDAL